MALLDNIMSGLMGTKPQAQQPQPQQAQPQPGALNMVRPSVSMGEDVKEQLESRLLGRYFGDEETEGSLEKLKRERDTALRRYADQLRGLEPVSEAEKFLAIGRGLGQRVRRDGGSELFQAAMNVGTEFSPLAEKESRLKREYKMTASQLLAEQAQKDYDDALKRSGDLSRLLMESQNRQARLGANRYSFKVGPNGMYRIDTWTGVPTLIDQNKFTQARMSAEQRIRDRYNEQRTMDAYIAQYGSDAARKRDEDMNREIASLSPDSIAEFMDTPAPSAKPEAPAAAPVSKPEIPSGGGGFDKAVTDVLSREGGFTPKDGRSGAPANFGINQRANPDIDVKSLTEDQAKQIYKTRYWDTIGADKLSPAAQEVAFDAAVNQGQDYAKKLIEETGGDAQKMIEQRRRDYIKIVERNPAQVSEFKGWMNRLDDVAAKAGVKSPTGQVSDEIPLRAAEKPTTAPAVTVTDKQPAPIISSGGIEKTKAQGKIEGEATANLPKAEAVAKDTLKTIIELDQHPGKAQAVGKSAMFGIQAIPFTEAGGFMNKLEQLKGKSFLQAFETLKGGGQITEIEGTKATNAINRLNNWTSETEFQTALDELKDIVYTALERSYRQAGKEPPANVREQLERDVKTTPRSKGFEKPKSSVIKQQFSIEQK